MVWGSFTPAHILSLALGGLGLWGLYLALRRASRKVQIAVLGALSFAGIAAIMFNLLAWGAPLDYLPLHLCSLNAMVLPVAVLSRNKTLCNLLLVWSLGALAALVANWAVAEAQVCSWVFVFYYFPHVLEFGIPILLFRLGLVKKDERCIGSTLGISALAYTLVHFANLALIRRGIWANYMYSIAPENPLLAAFYRVIPYRYWYMYLVVPILAVYLLILYAPQLRKGKG